MAVLCLTSFFPLSSSETNYPHLYYPRGEEIAHNVDCKRRSKDLSQRVFTCPLCAFSPTPYFQAQFQKYLMLPLLSFWGFWDIKSDWLSAFFLHLPGDLEFFQVCQENNIHLLSTSKCCLWYVLTCFFLALWVTFSNNPLNLVLLGFFWKGTKFDALLKKKISYLLKKKLFMALVKEQ